MYFLRIEELDGDQYQFAYRDMETREALFVSERFSNYNDCEDAAKKHKLYSNSEIKYHDVTPKK